MARPLIHRGDVILDAARDLVNQRGRPAATVQAISRASRAPSGSIYHHFGSRDGVLLAAWMRAIRRFQEELLNAVGKRPALEGAVAGALWTPRFAADHPADATLLLCNRREELIRRPITDLELLQEVESLNEAVKGALRRLAGLMYGAIGRPGYETITLAVVDIPTGAVRRYLRPGAALPGALPGQIEAAARAVLERGPNRPRQPAGS